MFNSLASAGKNAIAHAGTTAADAGSTLLQSMSNGKRGKACSFNSVAEMAGFIQKEGIELLDACFVDPIGIWHHCTMAASQCEEADLMRGFAFDGSSIRLFCTINNSDMVMMPDYKTCWVDPFYDHKVMHVTCSVEDSFGNKFTRCPRNTAERAVQHMCAAGVADTCLIGPEAEFFVFDDVRYACTANSVSFSVNATEGYWNTNTDTSSNRGNSRSNGTITAGTASTGGGDTAAAAAAACGNLAHRCGPKGFYFPVPPIDTMCSIRNDMLLLLGDLGLPIEKHHHEVAACQHELGFTCRPLVECADALMVYKYAIKNVARRHNKCATFMPKPLHADNGTGMHCHQSLWKDGVNLFWDSHGKYQKLSTMAMHYIGGLLKHAPAVLAFSNPTVNSYKRLVPGYEAPVNLAYSKGNRSAAIRIPLFDSDNPKAKRFEFRCPDASGCPYLCFAAMLMAGLDGIRNKTDPGQPMDVDIYELKGAEAEQLNVPSTPARLEEVLDALENDHEFLTAGDVFSEDFIKAYIAFKRDEAKQCSIIPHPKEYELYFQC
eukprot:GHVQ01041306.1.p1 GENE.GHVQ01041306.1~~GHVQ01041306.1.p1  ORF type:complete len:547 (+),score=77.01 GHVQ01041306.1:305-1945(+)